MSAMIRNSSTCLFVLMLFPPALATEATSDTAAIEKDVVKDSAELSERPTAMGQRCRQRHTVFRD